MAQFPAIVHPDKDGDVRTARLKPDEADVSLAQARAQLKVARLHVKEKRVRLSKVKDQSLSTRSYKRLACTPAEQVQIHLNKRREPIDVELSDSWAFIKETAAAKMNVDKNAYKMTFRTKEITETKTVKGNKQKIGQAITIKIGDLRPWDGYLNFSKKRGKRDEAALSSLPPQPVPGTNSAASSSSSSSSSTSKSSAESPAVPLAPA